MLKVDIFTFIGGFVLLAIWIAVIVLGEIAMAKKWDNIYKKKGRDDD